MIEKVRRRLRLCVLMGTLVSLLLAAPALAGLGAPAGDAEDAPFFFVQMADTQFGFFSTPLIMARFSIDWGGDDLTRETEHFEQAIAHVNRLRPAFVVLCGDLVNVAGDFEQTKEFQRIRGLLRDDVPLHLVAGNHDVGNTPTHASLRAYRATFGPDRYTFDHGSLRGARRLYIEIGAPGHAERLGRELSL